MHTHEGDASFIAIDTSLRLPPPEGKGALWRAYQDFGHSVRAKLRSRPGSRLSPNDTESAISKEWRLHGRAEAETRINAEASPLPQYDDFLRSQTAAQEPAQAGKPSPSKLSSNNRTSSLPVNKTKESQRTENDPTLVPCDHCGDIECDETGGKAMQLCDSCERGWHRSCLKMKTIPVDKFWHCPKCRHAGKRVEIWERTSDQYMPATIDQILES